MNNQKELSYKEWLEKSSHWCARQDRCRAEFKSKCYQWNVPESLRTELEEHLVKEGFIDDERYARSFVSGHLRIKGWGKEKIKAALAQKGIGGSLVNAIYHEFEEEEWGAALQKAVQKAIKNGHKASDINHTQKLIKHLMNKGFAYDDIKRALSSIEN